jgi:hypothetical protein
MSIENRISRTAKSAFAIALSLAIIEVLTACSVRHAPARCGFGDFAIGAAHMTNTIASTFVVPEFKGRLIQTFTSAEDWAGTPDLMRMQLNGPDGMVREVAIERDGSFDVLGLPEGTYCFHTSSILFPRVRRHRYH